MDTAQFADEVEYVLEVIGIVAFALSGAMLAIRKDFDVVGIALLAGLTALGGGIVRDLVIDSTPPAAFQHIDYLLLPGLVAAVAVFAHPLVDRVRRPILLFDALGLAVFTVNGTLLASQGGLSTVPAAMLGVTTGVGGGLLRDVIAREVPLIARRDSEIYAIPSALGALIVAVAHAQGAYSSAIGVAAAVAIFALRATAMTAGWRAPGARHRQEAAE